MKPSEPLRLGKTNYLPEALLTASPSPVTPLDWCKTEWASDLVRWTDLENNLIEINGTFPELKIIDYFAIIGTNLLGGAKYKLELLTQYGGVFTTYKDGFNLFGSLIPIGEWRAGIDPYGVPAPDSTPKVIVMWFDQPHRPLGFKLTIEPNIPVGSNLSDVKLRMLLTGTGLKVQRNFSHGNSISYFTGSNLKQTYGGSYVPTSTKSLSRVMTFPLDQMTDVDRRAISKLETSLGNRPFIISGYPGRKGLEFKDYSMLARIIDPLNYFHQREDIHETVLKVVEV